MPRGTKVSTHFLWLETPSDTRSWTLPEVRTSRAIRLEEPTLLRRRIPARMRCFVLPFSYGHPSFFMKT